MKNELFQTCNCVIPLKVFEVRRTSLVLFLNVLIVQIKSIFHVPKIEQSLARKPVQT